ncbi:hypothetical protein FNH22_25130 [Fulvivirga sp. M361]|uniref:CBU_0592 family membrane protein n=1 Tax=Fulvivirga sp. M361 TaxID=2594266 RepID=UPI001179A0D7|nr:hypothetical protein [Fulvivirga sp. M361]TRX50938.1 hypothetical protein FNH22_25130 [Fulvivirga sp. M361]
MTKLLIDIIGWVGSFEVILAYAMISYHKTTAKSLTYQLLNLTGGAFLIVNTIYYGAFPSTAINAVWLVIATVAIYNIFKNKEKNYNDK